MSKIDDGGMAFPGVLGPPSEFAAGLTKREHFAGLAMQGLLAANALYGGKSDARGNLAADAVAHADALIAALGPSEHNNPKSKD